MVGFPVGATSIITLTTDFGVADSYVGAMKGVILTIAPGTAIVDISHTVPPQNIAAGAYVLSGAAPYFPAGTVHVAVVDPGVGTARKAIAVETDRSFLVGPDNGLLCPALQAMGALEGGTGRLFGARAVELTRDAYFRSPVSATFHGRDIFAPVAAHLVRSVPLGELGRPIDCLECPAAPTLTQGGDAVRGEIVYVDHFGNTITNLPEGLLPADPIVEAGARTIRGLSSSYRSGPLVALVGSSGFLEIAMQDGNAAAELGLRVGDQVIVRSST
jgi:S-adenosylmethionine hydrolase